MKIYDDFGNSSSDTSSFSIYDNTPPLINVIDFTDNFNVPENEPFIMRWVQSDNIDISNHIFEYSSDGINYEILWKHLITLIRLYYFS